MNRKLDLYSLPQVTEATNDMSCDALVESCSAVSVTSENKDVSLNVYSEGILASEYNNLDSSSQPSPSLTDDNIFIGSSSMDPNTDQLHGGSSLDVPSSLTEDGDTLVCTQNKDISVDISCDDIIPVTDDKGPMCTAELVQDDLCLGEPSENLIQASIQSSDEEEFVDASMPTPDLYNGNTDLNISSDNLKPAHFDVEEYVSDASQDGDISLAQDGDFASPIETLIREDMSFDALNVSSTLTEDGDTLVSADISCDNIIPVTDNDGPMCIPELFHDDLGLIMPSDNPSIHSNNEVLVDASLHTPDGDNRSDISPENLVQASTPSKNFDTSMQSPDMINGTTISSDNLKTTHSDGVEEYVSDASMQTPDADISLAHDAYNCASPIEEVNHDDMALIESCSAVSLISASKDVSLKVNSEGIPTSECLNMNSSLPSSTILCDVASMHPNTDQLHDDCSLDIPSSLTEDGDTLVHTPNKDISSGNSCDDIIAVTDNEGPIYTPELFHDELGLGKPSENPSIHSDNKDVEGETQDHSEYDSNHPRQALTHSGLVDVPLYTSDLCNGNTNIDISSDNIKPTHSDNVKGHVDASMQITLASVTTPFCAPVSFFSPNRGSVSTVFKPDEEEHSTGVLRYSSIMLQSISRKIRALKTHAYSQMRSNFIYSKSSVVLSFPFKVIKLQMT